MRVRFSHDGKRWAGNMMSILERRFPPHTPHGELVALVEDRHIRLTPAWFVIARQHVIRSWSDHQRPQYSSNVGFVSFDAMVALFDDDPKEQKRRFNELAGRLLQTDYYERWIGAFVSR